MWESMWKRRVPVIQLSRLARRPCALLPPISQPPRKTVGAFLLPYRPRRLRQGQSGEYAAVIVGRALYHYLLYRSLLTPLSSRQFCLSSVYSAIVPSRHIHCPDALRLPLGCPVFVWMLIDTVAASRSVNMPAIPSDDTYDFPNLYRHSFVP